MRALLIHLNHIMIGRAEPECVWPVSPGTM